MKYSKYAILCISIFITSCPVFAQGAKVVTRLVKSPVSTATIIKNASLKGPAGTSSVRVSAPVLQSTIQRNAHLSVPSVNYGPKLMPYNPTVLSTALPALSQPASTISLEKSAPNLEVSIDEVADFYKWGKEGVEEDVYRTPEVGDPYETAQRELRIKETQWRNGKGKSDVSSKSSGFSGELEREQFVPTSLLSNNELREFQTTVSVGRDISQNPLGIVRNLDSKRRSEVLSGKWDPSGSRKPLLIEDILNSKNPLTYALEFPDFDVRNYLEFGTYSRSFNEEISQFNLLVASDEAGFVTLLQTTHHPRVQVTVVKNGQEAIAELSAHPEKYQVVLTDLYMTDGNGYKIAEHVQRMNLPTYTVAISKAIGGNPGRFFLLGFDGAMSVMRSPQLERDAYNLTTSMEPASYRSMEEIFAYCSHLIADGHAF